MHKSKRSKNQESMTDNKNMNTEYSKELSDTYQSENMNNMAENNNQNKSNNSYKSKNQKEKY